MCGIIGITTSSASGGVDGVASDGAPGAEGTREVLDVLLEGLGRLEYRGYDSAGVALVAPGGGAVWRARAANGTRSLDDLTKRVEKAPTGMSAGIGHTRWATHGRPSDENAHPHVDCTGRIALIHNGIIENHTELADELRAAGHIFESETDTEVLAHLVEANLTTDPADGLAGAVRAAIGRIRGTFSVAVVSADEPDLIVAARRVSPLLVGTTESATFLASDIPAILGLTHEFSVIEDDQVAELRPGSVRVTRLDGIEVEPTRISVDWDLEAARKDGYDDFMSKEIHEQPRAVADTLLDRLLPDGTLALDEMHIAADEFRTIDKVFIVACGSSYHAGLMAKYAIEHWARIPVEIDISSEFRYRQPVLDDHTLVIGVSQSGETTDTCEAVREARRLGARILVICNVVDSVDGPRERRRALHAGRPGDRCCRHQDPPGPDHGARDPRSLPGRGARHPVGRRRPQPHGGAWAPSPTRWRPCSSASATSQRWPRTSATRHPSSSSGATSATRWRSRARSSSKSSPTCGPRASPAASSSTVPSPSSSRARW